MKIENTLMTKQKCIQFSQQELPLNVFRMEDLIEKEDLLKFRKGETTVVQTVEKMMENFEGEGGVIYNFETGKEVSCVDYCRFVLSCMENSLAQLHPTFKDIQCVFQDADEDVYTLQTSTIDYEPFCFYHHNDLVVDDSY